MTGKYSKSSKHAHTHSHKYYPNPKSHKSFTTATVIKTITAQTGNLKKITDQATLAYYVQRLRRFGSKNAILIWSLGFGMAISFISIGRLVTELTSDSLTTHEMVHINSYFSPMTCWQLILIWTFEYYMHETRQLGYQTDHLKPSVKLTSGSSSLYKLINTTVLPYPSSAGYISL